MSRERRGKAQEHQNSGTTPAAPHLLTRKGKTKERVCPRFQHHQAREQDENTAWQHSTAGGRPPA